MKRLINRWKSETPVIFKKIQKGLVSIAGAGVAAQAYITTVSATIPEWMNAVINYSILCGIVGAFLAQFTKTPETPFKDLP